MMALPDNWKIIVAGGMALGLASFVLWLVVSRAHLEAELAKTQADVAICRNINADWAEKTKSAAEAARKAKIEAARLIELRDKAMIRAEKEATAHRQLAKRILRMTSGGDECQAVRDLMEKFAGR
jgi:multidrug resistance efflux pump